MSPVHGLIDCFTIVYGFKDSCESCVGFGTSSGLNPVIMFYIVICYPNYGCVSYHIAVSNATGYFVLTWETSYVQISNHLKRLNIEINLDFYSKTLYSMSLILKQR